MLILSVYVWINDSFTAASKAFGSNSLVTYAAIVALVLLQGLLSISGISTRSISSVWI
ncbi:hypothetical protein BD410DRAFT_797152 [Rickenella mellea]|uniref:Chitin synthase export chaperone n=1 Tax=Rickenella mellea TaxID=50990 RepID=A0A4Y7PIX3_9AGAM|nr:hypothetical protein BD410DRAFT_797152 [Rickenella mellea]